MASKIKKNSQRRSCYHVSRQAFSEKVKLAATGQWDSILKKLCGLSDTEVNPRKKNIPCPICGGTDRYEFKTPDNGKYYCRVCSGWGDGFTLIMKMTQCSFYDAVQKVALHLGIENKSYNTPFQAQAENKQLALLAEERRRKQAIKQAIEDAKEKQKQKEVAENIPSILASAQPANPKHPYLVRKRLPPLGVRQIGSWLQIPLYADGHRLVNIERITPEGDKRGLKGGQRKGVYHRFGGQCWTVYICEGWATGASLYLMENQSVRVYSAMGKGNLLAVAKIAKSQNPDSRCILVADNDTHLAGNPGLNEALKAAKAIEATLILPNLSEQKAGGCDFSDYFLSKGGW